MDPESPLDAMIVEMILFVFGAYLAGSSTIRLRELHRDRPRSGWRRMSATVTDVSAESTTRGSDLPLATRVTYTYQTVAGPATGTGNLPPGMSIAEGMQIPIEVAPERLNRSHPAFSAPRRGPRLAAAILELVVGLALIGYVVLAVTGVLPPHRMAYVTARIGLGVGALATAGVAKALRGKTAPDATEWVKVLATVEKVVRTKNKSDVWFVSVGYEGPDGLERTGCARFPGKDKPSFGLKARILVDPDRPGRFRFPGSTD